VTREEATEAARKLGTEHPDRATHRWMPREGENGEWTVVKLAMPPGARIDPLKTTTESRPKPPEPDDPRTAYDRNVGGPWVG